MPLRLFTRPHNYEIQEILGESPLSIVYLAHRFNKNIRCKQRVVIKVFKQASLSLPQLQLESVLRVKHCPHLVKALAFEQFGSRIALIFEHILGPNLKQLLRSCQLSAEDSQYICAQVLQGLEELRQNGLCHGDLSLSNILIDTKGQVFLTDYGMANYASSRIYGTRPFNAPELQQAHPPNFQSDLFSLGVVEKSLSLSEQDMQNMDPIHFVQPEDPLLNEIPSHREKKPFSFSRYAQAKLGAKVQQVYSSTSFHKPVTALPSCLKKKHSFIIPSVGITAIFLLFLLAARPLTSHFHSSRTLSHPRQTSKVLIRTKKWAHIQLAGYQGYTPIKIPIHRPGTYQLKWKTQARQGQKYITLKSGQILILRDYDLTYSKTPAPK